MGLFKTLANNPFSNAIKNVRLVLDPDQKKRSLIMIVLLVINAIFDFTGLASIGALIKSALADDIFEGASYVRPSDEADVLYFINSKLRALYDYSGAESSITFLFYLSILIFLAFIIKNAVGLYIGYIQSRFAFNVSFRLNQKMFKYFYDQGYLFIKDSASGKKVYSIVDVPMRFASHYLNTLITFGTELFILFIIALALLFYDPLAVVMLGITIVPTFWLIYNFTKNKSKEIGERRNSLAPLNYGAVFEAMNGYVDVKLSNIENEMLEKYASIQKKINHVDTIYLGIYQKLNQRTNDIIFGLGILVIFGYAHFTGQEKDQVLQLLGLFAIAAYKFLPSVNRMMSALLTLKNSSFVIDELNKINDTQLVAFGRATPLNFEKSLSINNLSYQYPSSDVPVLDGINLTIEKGQTIGFIGTSGSGKTTLLKIFLRLLNENEGKMALDDITINDKNRSAFQKIIGHVAQEIFILNDSIINNVAFGQEAPDEAKVWQSLKEAQLDTFVKSHPDGLNMLLGENGVNLSGGQKQRIGIARALYKDSQILIFDEATSALDNETERAVVDSINLLSTLGKTVVIVAHRITTLEKCDKIYELDGGKLIAEHQYERLLQERVLN